MPNPKALVPNWKTSTPLEPFLNEKICQYQIAITTRETTTGGDSTTTEEEAEANLQDFYSKYNAGHMKKISIEVFKKNKCYLTTVGNNPLSVTKMRNLLTF